MADLDPDEILTQIIQGPASASGDAGSVTQQDPLKIIEVEKYTKAKAASAAGGLGGVRMFGLRQPGAS